MRRLIVSFMMLCAAAPAAADEKAGDAGARARLLAPFLDQAAAVVRVDVSRLDTDALFAKAADLVKTEVKDRASRAAVRKYVAAFTKAGGKEVYLVVSPADFPTAPVFAVVPLGADADVDALSRLLGGVKAGEHDPSGRSGLLSHPLETCVQGAFIVAGGKAALDRLKGAKLSPRPELEKALAAVGDAAVQLILLPTKDQRRVVEEMLPTLPKELGDGPVTAVTHGVQWAALGVEASPRLSVRLVVQSPDAEAATALRELVVKSLELLGKQEEIRRLLPDFDRLRTRFTPEVKGDRLVLAVDDMEVTATLSPLLSRARSAAAESRSMNNLRQIGLALHTYHDSNGVFPAVANFDKADKPLLSWRVHLLPYLEQAELYKQFKLDEPWDSENNKKLIAKMPAIYRSPVSAAKAGRTVYLAPVNAANIFTGDPKAVKFSDIRDGTSRTILLVEADDDRAVEWTKPDDLKHDPEKPKAGLGGRADGGIVVLIADGSTLKLPAKIDAKKLRALFTRAGDEPVQP